MSSLAGVMTSRHFFIFFWIIAVAVPLAYAGYTQHVWEDFFITFKYSRNLVEGLGLVYNEGERVHGFTSVINTLLPALFYWLSGAQSWEPALWGYRVISALFFATAGWVVFRHLWHEAETPRAALWLFAVLYLFSPKIVIFTANGMEAGFLVFFTITAALLLYDSAERHWKWLGVLWAGLMYTRPDGFVYAAGMSAAALILATDRRALFRHLLRAALLGIALYLPWFVFVWWYYGTPVPHTIIAKSVYGLGRELALGQWLLSYLYNMGQVLAGPFQPIYFGYGGWAPWIVVFSYLAGAFCFIYWLLPVGDRLGRYLSLQYVSGTAYLAFLGTRGTVFDWYFPPLAVIGTVVLARGVPIVWRRYLAKGWLRHGGAVAGAGLAVALVVVFASVTWQMKVQQQVVENGQRAVLGRWLAEHSGPGDTLLLEPLGYIGYFSGLRTFDWPGLVSPRTVAVCRKYGGSDWRLLAREIGPTWLVVRPFDLARLNADPWFKRHYELVKVFDVVPEIFRHKGVPGIGYLMFDARFLVFRRQARPLAEAEAAGS